MLTSWDCFLPLVWFRPSSRPEVLSVTQGLDEEERAELRPTLLTPCLQGRQS